MTDETDIARTAITVTTPEGDEALVEKAQQSKLSRFNKWRTRSILQPKTLIMAVIILVLIVLVVVYAQRPSTCDLLTDTRRSNPWSKDNSDRQLVNYRLPRNIAPKNYNIHLQPDIGNKIINGIVNITFLALENTNTITLHASNLSIKATKLTSNNGNIIKVKGIMADAITEFLKIELIDTVVKSEKYVLNIVYHGRLDRGLVGFYASKMKDGRTMVASKFQPTYARQAFPCFDEPEYKATFDITLVKPSGYEALSNMHEVSRTLLKGSDNEAVTFATSVPMSTYLACFVICDFGFKEVTIDSHGIGTNFMLRAFAQKNELHKIDFALDIGKRATEFYIRYYDVPFPLSKLDMIAIPDYISGATEHWGLITYRETSFLMDEKTSSVHNKISIANTIAHELAHMWFGNLVTLKWWDDLWLNEGFASYMQIKCLNDIEPSWHMYEKLQTTTLHSVLVTDAKLSSHPIVQTAESPDEITALFDSISYNKGASILRMLEGFVGEENFRQGISKYLKKYKYGNTVTQDLLSILEPYFVLNNSGLNLSYIMDTWTRQMGYPVLYITNVGQGQYEVSQKRFLLDPEAKDSSVSPYGYRWYVPITYKTNLRVSPAVTWFADKIDNGNKTITLKLNEGEIWLKLNNEQVGYYRVNYSEDLWKALIEQLKKGGEQLSTADRANLLDDVFALAEARMVPYELALNLSTYLEIEKNYAPWNTADGIFGDLKVRLRNSLAVDELKKYVQNLVRPLYEQLSLEKTDADVGQRLLRSKILAIATKMDLPDAQNKMRSLFLQWLSNYDQSDKAGSIEPDLRSLVYSHGMQSATMEEWDKLWDIYLRVDDVQERTKLQSALAAPRDTSILKKYLILAWDEKNVRAQDYLHVLQYVSNNPSGTALVWNEVRTIWPQLVMRYSLNSRYLGNLIPAITSSFNTELQLEEVEAFFSKYPESGAGEAARQRTLENVRNNIKWNKNYEGPVTAWLQAETK